MKLVYLNMSECNILEVYTNLPSFGVRYFVYTYKEIFFVFPVLVHISRTFRVPRHNGSCPWSNTSDMNAYAHVDRFFEAKFLCYYNLIFHETKKIIVVP